MVGRRGRLGGRWRRHGYATGVRTVRLHGSLLWRSVVGGRVLPRVVPRRRTVGRCQVRGRAPVRAPGRPRSGGLGPGSVVLSWSGSFAFTSDYAGTGRWLHRQAV